MKMFSVSRIQKALLASVAFHLLLTGFVHLSGQLKTHPHQVITMDIIETPPASAPAAVVATDKVEAKKARPKDDQIKIVDQPDKALNNEVDDQAKFLSKNNQKVIKQTVAKNRGEFQNRAAQGPQGQRGSAEPETNPLERFLPQFDAVKAVTDQKEREQEYEQDAEALMAQKKIEKTKVAAAAVKVEKGTGDDATKGSDTSQTLDYIKDLDPGLETLLSSKEFKYYTYFSRVRTQLNTHWTPKVRTKVTQMYRKGRRIAASDDMITRCLVTLDRSGKLVKVQIIGNSGVIELDEAAVEAFRSAAPFPNPPSGMVDGDGTIKIRWDFILEA